MSEESIDRSHEAFPLFSKRFNLSGDVEREDWLWLWRAFVAGWDARKESCE